MDIPTYIQKVSDAIYAECQKKRKYKDILKNVETSVFNETMCPIPFFYINVLNVLEDMKIESSDEMIEKIKKYSRELTLSRLNTIVADIFERYYDEEDEDEVIRFKKQYEKELTREFKHVNLLAEVTTNIIQDIRNITKDFICNIETFDFASFDKEITENLYDCIDCEEDFEDSEESESEYDPGSDEESETEVEESETEDEESVDEAIYELLDSKVAEIAKLKEINKELELKIQNLSNANKQYQKISKVNEDRANLTSGVLKVMVVTFLALFIIPVSFQDTKYIIDYELLN